jgi:predicted nucleotidyltransferase
MKEKRQITQQEIEHRRRDAMDAAERCVRMLKERFGAHRVIPFGSAVGDGLWHVDSDLDLAVEGVSPEMLWKAERELETMVPTWLSVDVVPLECVSPDVRASILGGNPMPENPYLALKVRLEHELSDIERVVQGLESALERAGIAPDEFATRALASYVEDFYEGCERICERVAVTLDGGLPQGERWHQVLLGEPSGGGRPPLFGGSLLLELDAYRRFRHRVRHVYGYELEAGRVVALARGVKPVEERIRKAVEVVGRWLDSQVAGTSEKP